MDVDGFLRSELKGPFREVRVSAAEGLLVRGHDDGVAAMIQNWAHTLGDEGEVEGLSWVVEFLAECNKPQAIRALARDLPKRPAAWRWEVTSTLRSPFPRYAHGRSLAVVQAIEELLVQELDDCESYKEYRICDVSGEALASLWGHREQFESAIPLPVRDRNIALLKRAWARKTRYYQALRDG
jgi:hypothetical protein